MVSDADEVGDDLIGVHVGGGAGAGLVDVDGEVLGEAAEGGEAVGDFAAGFDDGVGALFVEAVESAVDGGAGGLEERVGLDDAFGDGSARDWEVEDARWVLARRGRRRGPAWRPWCPSRCGRSRPRWWRRRAWGPALRAWAWRKSSGRRTSGRLVFSAERALDELLGVGMADCRDWSAGCRWEEDEAAGRRELADVRQRRVR